MPGRAGSDTWASARWRRAATAWLDEQLDNQGIRRTGDVEQPHLRPWATVLSAPTTAGRVWLKALGAATAFEAGLYQLLQQAVPQRVLALIAVDAGRGWILLPDGGPPLADRLAGAGLAGALATILGRYGELQRDFAPQAGAALAIGVADMRPQVMPARFEDALEAAARPIAVRGDGSTRAVLRQVATLRGTYRSWCERLAGAPGAASPDHNDLHPWNMLVPRLDQPDMVRFYDWGRRCDHASVRRHARPAGLGAAPACGQPPRT